MRARIVERLGWLGAELDAAANESGDTRIAAPDSRIGLYVVPTDEELMIARHTLSLLSRRSFSEPNDDWGGIPGDIWRDVGLGLTIAAATAGSARSPGSTPAGRG